VISGRAFHLAKVALAPALLGVGAIFQTKVRPDDHWSTSPKIVTLHEVDAAAASRDRRPGGRFV
jgi:hypothetical protein